VRIRPTISHDLASIPTRFQRTVIHPSSATTVTIENLPTSGGPTSTTATPTSNAPKKSVFAFDQVLPPEATQYELYNATASPLISRFVEGFNCTILAYGQTSSGKTYSMTGVDLDADPTDPYNGMGIIPRAISTIFSRAVELKRERGSAWQWSVKASFIEIYNEDLIDLLAVDDASGSRREVQIREEKDGTIIWTGLREIPVRSAADVMSYVRLCLIRASISTHQLSDLH
jgi:kinesin family protein 4/21/27